ncbi:MAG: amino acid permease [Thermodesulfobacteriota bacterium]|jgi:APA family basic amino acid/polyamine antiporter
MELKRELTLSDATLLVVGNVVGAGIFTTSGFLAGELPHPLLFIGIWVLGGLITLFGALTYAELAGMFPKAGGDYQFLKAGYGLWAGFLLGWVNFWIIIPGSIAALSLALVSYMKPLLALNGSLLEKGLALGIILFFSWINYRGIRWGGTTQDFFTLGSIVLLVAFIAGGLIFGKGSWDHFTIPSSQPPPFSKIFGSAMIAIIFTYSGWFASAYVGSEIKKPERNIPLSLLLGTAIVGILYSLINVTYLYALPLTKIKGVVNVGQVTATALFNSTISTLISLAIILAICSSINATIMAGSRIFYAMSEDKIFWSFLKRLHPRFHSPYLAILSQTVLAVLLVCLGTFSQLLSYVVFVMLIISIATGASHLILRWQKPGLLRPYLTWGYPLVPILFTLSYLWISKQIFMEKPSTSFVGLLLAVSGIPFYFFWAKSKKAIKGDKE